MGLRSPEPSEEEESPEQKAERDRYGAAVLLHPPPQGAERPRGPLGRGRIQADEHEYREGEYREHKPERQNAALGAEARRDDQLYARYEDREALDLAREERHPEPERPWRRHGFYRLHPRGWGRVGIGRSEQAPQAEDEEQRPDRNADDTADSGDGVLRPAEEGEPCDTHRRAGGEVPEREGTGVGEGPPGAQKQDREEEQRGRDRTPNSQDCEPGERTAHGCSRHKPNNAPSGRRVPRGRLAPRCRLS